MKIVLSALFLTLHSVSSAYALQLHCRLFLMAMAHRPLEVFPTSLFADAVDEGVIDDNQHHKSGLIRILTRLDELQRYPQINKQKIEELNFLRKAFLLGDPELFNRGSWYRLKLSTERKANWLSESKARKLQDDNFLIEIDIPEGGVSPFPSHANGGEIKRKPIPPSLSDMTDYRRQNIGFVSVSAGELVRQDGFIKLPYGTLNRSGSLMTVNDGVWISETPVTQLQWAMVMGKNPSWFTANSFLSIGGTPVDPHRPVEYYRDQSELFLATLNSLHRKEWEARKVKWEQTHKEPFAEKYWEYRWPFTMEWEYAARAGSGSPVLDFPRGFTLTDGNYEHSLKRHAWVKDSRIDLPTQRVGSLLPNAWGLYDMLGNVSELTTAGDRYHFRGGSVFDDPSQASSLFFNSSYRNSGTYDKGLRLIREERP